MNTFVAVPVKDLANAKQRLIPVLSAAERRSLAHAMLEDVLHALATALPAPAHVVTTDAQVVALARECGAHCLLDSADRGHTEAVAFAQQHARSVGADRFLTVPGDVPCVTADEVRALLRAIAGERAVAFVPSLSGLGTNGALLVPPDVMPLKFGEPSFANHLEAARRRGLAPRVVSLPGLGLDIDAPEDLPMLLERGVGSRSAALLRKWDIMARAALSS